VYIVHVVCSKEVEFIFHPSCDERRRVIANKILFSKETANQSKYQFSLALSALSQLNKKLKTNRDKLTAAMERFYFIFHGWTWVPFYDLKGLSFGTHVHPSTGSGLVFLLLFHTPWTETETKTESGTSTKKKHKKAVSEEIDTTLLVRTGSLQTKKSTYRSASEKKVDRLFSHDASSCYLS